MSSYTVIADVSRSVLSLLRTALVPELVKKEELIGLCPPHERESVQLGLYLYNMDENPEMRSQEKQFLDREHFKDPPLSLNLYYMMYACSDADISVRALDEQRILGRAIQQLNDFRRLPQENLRGTLTGSGGQIELQMIVLPFEEKIRIWSLFSQPYRLCAFYKAGPVLLDSAVVRQSKRVTDARFTVKEKGRMNSRNEG